MPRFEDKTLSEWDIIPNLYDEEFDRDYDDPEIVWLEEG